MKGFTLRRLVLLLAVVGAMLVLAVPAMATSDNRTPTGSFLSFSGPTTFSANTPFFVQHGFSCAIGVQGDKACGLGTGMFSLYLDGVLQPSVKVVGSLPGSIVGEGWLTNFPNGLPAGDHTLVGVWTLRGAVFQTASITVTFS